MGSRYGGLKQVDPVGPSGEAILDYSVFDALRGGFGKVVFVIRRDFEAEFKEKIGRKFEALMPVDYCYQDTVNFNILVDIKKTLHIFRNRNEKRTIYTQSFRFRNDFFNSFF
ncbi:MAG: hypothetical protein IKS56_08770 [Lachnospiraceae bacterium]|nr:hypothetical protein [Lachnospiraceae bacterium]